jgi:hypothetical protein
MDGRHKRPEPPMRRKPWYVWILPVVPLPGLVFALVGWWPRYRFVAIAAGGVLVILSAVLQLRDWRKSSTG